MQNRSTWGIILVVLGLISLSYTGIRYRSHENILQVGSVVLRADRTRTLPPWAGGLAIAAGVALLIARRDPQ